MAVYMRQQLGNYRVIRLLFAMGLVGLILAGTGIVWLMTGYAKFENELAQQNAKLVQRAARYDGDWANNENSGLVSISISNNGLNLTVHVVDAQHYEGTNSETFTSEPIVITISLNPTELSPASLSYDVNMTMILNNTVGTQLKVVANTYSYIFIKVGS